MSELSSIKSQALTERIEERLFAYILDNHLKVGAKLPNEHELAAHFEVSRGTVREAGLDAVEDKLQLALDLTDVRLMLEPTIAALAAQNRTDEEVAQLAEYCDAVREKIEAGEDYLIEDMRFHWFLAKCSHNMVVEPLMPIIDAAVISIANITRRASRHEPHLHPPDENGAIKTVETVAKLQFRRQVCSGFAEHGRPKVPMRKLSPSQGIKTEVHAPGFYAITP